MRCRPISDFTLAAVAWVSCLSGCLIFAGLMVGTTGLMEGFNWVSDKCTVYDQDDDCLSGNVDCSVSVYHRNNPVCSLSPLHMEGADAGLALGHPSSPSHTHTHTNSTARHSMTCGGNTVGNRMCLAE